MNKSDPQPISNHHLLVMKFGGTSVGSSHAIENAIQIIQHERTNWNNLIVVLSAMAGVTDSLIDCAHAAVGQDSQTVNAIITEIKEKHRQVIDTLANSSEVKAEIWYQLSPLFANLQVLCHGIQIMGELTPRGLDAVSSFGERMNIRLFSTLLNQFNIHSRPVDADALIVTDNAFNQARPLMVDTREKCIATLSPILSDKKIPVVTGFMGATRQGIVTTMGRGGSDFTAAVLGSCLDADEVWTWTDVDGVMSADPKIVRDAQVIAQITYKEIAEMAYFGAKVLHPKTIQPLIEKRIPLFVKNSFNASAPGTCITSKANSRSGQITAVTAIQDLCLITVEGCGMIGVPGMAARTFKAVAKCDASVLMISQSSSEQSICFVIPSANEHDVINAIEKEMAFELSRHDIDRVRAQDHVVIISAIGAGMRKTPGVSARLFGVLGKEKINVIAIAQGSSEYSISIVVDEKDAKMAIQSIHHEVIINGNK